MASIMPSTSMYSRERMVKTGRIIRLRDGIRSEYQKAEGKDLSEQLGATDRTHIISAIAIQMTRHTYVIRSTDYISCQKGVFSMLRAGPNP